MGIDYWVKNYGNETIEHVYETPSGCIWLVGKKNDKGFREGLVKIQVAEWGYIDLDELVTNESGGLLKPIRIFKKVVPCTLKKLFDETVISSYFGETN